MKLLRFVRSPGRLSSIVLAAHALSACGGSSRSGGRRQPGPGEARVKMRRDQRKQRRRVERAGLHRGGSPGGATNVRYGRLIPDGGFVLPPVEAGALGGVLPGAPGVSSAGGLLRRQTNRPAARTRTEGAAASRARMRPALRARASIAPRRPIAPRTRSAAPSSTSRPRPSVRRVAMQAVRVDSSRNPGRSSARWDGASARMDRPAPSRAARGRPSSSAASSAIRGS